MPITRRLFNFRTLAVLIFVLILAAVAYAYAAANVVPESGAGDGQGTISGYTVSNITYDFYTDGDPTDIDLVTFDIAPTAGAQAPNNVYIELNGTGTWIACSPVAGTTWDCAVTGVTVLSADNLRVVAAQ